MTEITDKIKDHLEAQLPFAVYCKPGASTVTGLFGSKNSIKTTTDLSGKGFVFAPFSGDEAVFLPAAECEVLTQHVDLPLAEIPSAPEFTVDVSTKEAFEELVEKCVTAIKSNTFTKLVASRTETVETDTDVDTIFRRLLPAYPNAFRYCFYSEMTGLWMGATPEQLLQANKGKIHTVALAGTQVYNAEKEAVWQEKEQEEQQIVTDYITQALQESCTNITATSPYTFRAGNIVHIKTDITAQLKNDIALSDVIKKLHPTPAVCGMPKEEAAVFLKENEGYNREFYSGFLGELNTDFSSGQQDKSDLFVNLRCMKIKDSTAQLFIGCGITKDSDPEKEFLETVNKSITMRRVL
ncbi:isochorismate synthase [Flavobacterium coralii]|uniref:isochorismate synthase n=1 Tax=Flavobacterium coralii TaxID=2838017 RepID=UPI000C5E7D4B|nr:isochorismate synthase [Flavobacterium sp.]|tara:strand:- start:33575 stop:34633 length:1059 start_codon:yes stop_codon:yes gene_type:complete